MSFASVKYTGDTPGADTNTYTLLNSITGKWPGYWPALHGIHKVLIDIHHDKGGTLKWYKSMDDVDTASPTWVQMDEVTVAAPVSTDGSQVEFLVEAQKHVKIDWVNGGTAQTTFHVNIALTDQRAGA